MTAQKSKFPSVLQTSILRRAIGDKGFEDLHEQYISHKQHHRGSTPPSDKQIRLASLIKKVGYKEAAKQVGVPVETAYYALGRVAKFNYMKKK